MASKVGDAALNIVVDQAALGRSIMSAIAGQEPALASEGQRIGKALGVNVGKGSEGGLSSFQKLGAGASALGLVVAGVSLKMALDFESSMTSIKALTGSSSEDIALYRKEILSLSGEVAQSPKKLAEALYFVSSAGFSGKEAIDVLTVSAKAAAAGMTETQVVADAVTSAMNAYGHENLSARTATDVLVQSVTDGKAEFGDMAGAIGQVVNAAAAADITFNEVGASLASLTSVGLSADEAATVLKSTIVALEAPSEKVRDLLGQLGLSADDVRESIRDKGLIATVQDLGERLGGNIGPILELIPNHRTLALVMGATGAQAEQYRLNLEHANHATDGAGATARAFAERQKDVAFQFSQIVTTLQAAAVAFGEKLIPVMHTAIVVGTATAGWLGDNKVAAYALAVIIGGPLVAAMVSWAIAEARIVGGKLVSFWSSVLDVAVGLLGRLLGLNTALATVGQTEAVVAAESRTMAGSLALAGGAIAGITVLAGAYLLMRKEQQDSSRAAKTWAADVIESVGGISHKTLPELKAALADVEDKGKGFWNHLNLNPLSFESAGKKAEKKAKELKEQIVAFETEKQDSVEKTGAFWTRAAVEQGKAATTIGEKAQELKDKHDEAAAGVVAAFSRISASFGTYGASIGADLTRTDDQLKELVGGADKVRDAYGSLAPAAAQGLVALAAQGKITVDQLAAVATEAQALKDGMASSFGQATSIVQAFGDKASVTFAEINKFFKDQVAAARDWSGNLKALAHAGVDQGLIAELAQAGPKAAPLVKGLLDDVKRGNLGVINQSQIDLRQILSDTQGTILGYETPFFLAGQTDGQGLVSGLGQGTAGAGAALAGAMATAIAASNLYAYLEGSGRKAGELFAGGFNGAVQRGIVTSFETSGGGRQSLSAVSRRDGGGPVVAGEDYWVGEEGPEIFRSETRGYIVPHDEAVAATSTTRTRDNTDGGAARPINVYPRTDADAHEIAAEISWAERTAPR